MPPRFKRAKLSSPFEDLLDDMFAEILTRLSAKLLVKCGLVCKSWLALISTSSFAALHFRRRLHRTGFNLVEENISDGDKPLEEISSENKPLEEISSENKPLDKLALLSFKDDHDDTTPVTDFVSPSCNTGPLMFYGSSHGLVCVEYEESGAVVLWNPYTGETKRLPEPEPIIILQQNQAFCNPKEKVFPLVVFGYDSTNGEYKVLRAPKVDANNVIFGSAYFCYRLHL